MTHAIPPVDPQLLVHEFHKVYRHPIADSPRPPAADRTNLRVSLVAEEFIELLEAVYAPQSPNTPPPIAQIKREVRKLTNQVPVLDLKQTADALADLVYVIYGFALEAGIPLSAIFEEVHASNMSKLDPTTNQPIYREDGKVLKGANFREPDIDKFLQPNPTQPNPTQPNPTPTFVIY